MFVIFVVFLDSSLVNSYMTAASLIGFFNAPLLRRLRPRPHDTSLIKVMIVVMIDYVVLTQKLLSFRLL